MKFGSSIDIFFSSAQLICRSTDISKCFRGSLRLRDNESRLYFKALFDELSWTGLVIVASGAIFYFIQDCFFINLDIEYKLN